MSRDLGLQPMRGNVQGKDVGRIHDKPRARVYRAAGVVGFGPASANCTFDTLDYDTDGMSTPLGQFLTCRTAGTYYVQGHIEYATGAGARFTRIIFNNAAANVIAGTATANSVASTAGIATWHDLSGMWKANAGDTVSLYVTTFTDASNLNGGQYSQFLSACLIST